MKTNVTVPLPSDKEIIKRLTPFIKPLVPSDELDRALNVVAGAFWSANHSIKHGKGGYATCSSNLFHTEVNLTSGDVTLFRNVEVES